MKSEDIDVRLGRRVIVVIAVAVMLAATALHAAVPSGALDLLSPKDRLRIRGVIPEGWAFFTKSPREPSPLVFRREPDGRWTDITAGPLAMPDYLMGLDRKGRAQGTELAMVVNRLPKSAWHECEGAPLVCLNATPVATTVPNRSHHTVCGDVGFVLQQVLPWAWRDAPTVMPSQVTRVKVTC